MPTFLIAAKNALHVRFGTFRTRSLLLFCSRRAQLFQRFTHPDRQILTFRRVLLCGETSNPLKGYILEFIRIEAKLLQFILKIVRRRFRTTQKCINLIQERPVLFGYSVGLFHRDALAGVVMMFCFARKVRRRFFLFWTSAASVPITAAISRGVSAFSSNIA